MDNSVSTQASAWRRRFVTAAFTASVQSPASRARFFSTSHGTRPMTCRRNMPPNSRIGSSQDSISQLIMKVRLTATGTATTVGRSTVHVAGDTVNPVASWMLRRSRSRNASTTRWRQSSERSISPVASGMTSWESGVSSRSSRSFIHPSERRACSARLPCHVGYSLAIAVTIRSVTAARRGDSSPSRAGRVPSCIRRSTMRSSSWITVALTDSFNTALRRESRSASARSAARSPTDR